jgi:hypothetical protein
MKGRYLQMKTSLLFFPEFEDYCRREKEKEEEEQLSSPLRGQLKLSEF